MLSKSAFKAISTGYNIYPIDLLPSKILAAKKLFTNIDKYDQIISVVRLRNLKKYLPSIQNFARNIPFVIYDQDPWENYIDSSPLKGTYNLLKENLNIKKIYVTSPFGQRN